MYGCENWTTKKAECRRINAFELWCWRRLLRVPWTARRSNQSILKKSVLNFHWKDWCWSWNSNTLATWCEGLTHWKRPWCWAKLKVGGEGDNRVWDGWMSSPTRWTWLWVGFRRWWWTGKPGVLQSSTESDSTEWLNWTELIVTRLVVGVNCNIGKYRLIILYNWNSYSVVCQWHFNKKDNIIYNSYKIDKELKDLSSTINQHNPAGIYKTLNILLKGT